MSTNCPYEQGQDQEFALEEPKHELIKKKKKLKFITELIYEILN